MVMFWVVAVFEIEEPLAEISLLLETDKLTIKILFAKFSHLLFAKLSEVVNLHVAESSDSSSPFRL